MIVTVRKNLEINVHAGNFTNCIEFFFDMPDWIDDELRITVAPGVGIIRRSGAWESKYLLRATTDSLIIASVSTREIIPFTNLIHQNYPNPFNPSTTIRFDIPKESHVSLKVYNLLGQEVATLVDEVKKLGRYEVVWDAFNFPSGIYYYRLAVSSSEARNLVLFGKMILLK